MVQLTRKSQSVLPAFVSKAKESSLNFCDFQKSRGQKMFFPRTLANF